MTTTDTRPALQTQPPRPVGWQATLSEFLAVAANLADAGYSTGEEIARINAIEDAVAVATSPRTSYPTDLLDMDPEDVVTLVRHQVLNIAGHDERAVIGRVTDGLDHHLARSAAASLAARSDAFVAAMRKEFAPALKKVQTAAGAGLTSDTDAATLVDGGTTAQIAAWRELGPAVAVLDRVASLRTQLTNTVGVGPVEYPVAAFVTDVPDMLHLDSAQNVWRGRSEWEQRDLPTIGSHMAQVPVRRLGGPWLALLTGGYTVRLNTGSEAHAVLAAARQG